MNNITLFDLDNTLLTCDSDHEWGQFLASQGLLDANSYQKQNDQYYEDYVAGTLDIYAFLRFALKPLKEIETGKLMELRKQFLTTIIPKKVASNIHEKLRQHQSAGEQCAIITATNDFITQPIADFFEVPLIATRAAKQEGRYTGEVKGLPCFGSHKIDRLNEWLKDNRLDRAQHKLTFYSDSFNDLPLLKHSDCPIAVNPDARLESIAESMQWPCLFHLNKSG